MSDLNDTLLPEREDRGKQPLMDLINEMQDAVSEMKQALLLGLEQMKAASDEDANLRRTVDGNRAEAQEQAAQVLRLVLSFKSEFAWVRSALEAAQEQSATLSRAVQRIDGDREALLSELVACGAISQHARDRLHSNNTSSVHCRCGEDPRPEHSSSSGAPSSSDSGVAHLLERGPKQGEEDDEVGPGEAPGEERRRRRRDSPDSDSSLSRAISKSLGLSTSLGRQCGLELDNQTTSPKKQEAKPLAHADSDTESSRLLSAQLTSIGDRPDGPSTTRNVQNDKGKLDFRNSLDESSLEEGDVEKQRRDLLLELIDTERCYCDTLRTLRQTFAEPLSVQDILSPKDVDTLFPREVEALYEQHTSLLAMLEDCIGSRGSHTRTIGDILRHFIEPEGLDALHLYTSYVDNFPDALQTFHKLCRCSPEFTNFLKDCLKSPDCGGLDLGGFLLTPVQRLPRLVLVLRRLLAITPQRHPDWAPLSFTINRLATFLSRLNDSMEHSFQLVAAQLSTPPETEEDFGHLDTFDDVCGESTANEEMLNDLTSDGETATEANMSVIGKSVALETEIIDHGVRRRMGQRVVSSDWEKRRTISAISGGLGEASSIHGRANSPIYASPLHVSPERGSNEPRHKHHSSREETTPPTKNTGCHCVRRCRGTTKCATKYSKVCSVKGSREGRSSQDLMMSVDARGGGVSSTSEWATGGGGGGRSSGGDHSRKRVSRCDKAERPVSAHCRDSFTPPSSPSCCVHDCVSSVERRRGTSLPRRGCGVEVRRRTHSTGRTAAREQDTSSDDDLSSGGHKSCFHSSSGGCRAQELPSKGGKGKRRWFKASKSMHDFEKEASEAFGSEGKGSRLRRRSSEEREGKLSVARSVDNLSVDSLSSGKEGRGGGEEEGVKRQGGVPNSQGGRQVMYTARMLRCSSLEVATMGKANDVIQASTVGGGGGATVKEDGDGKKGKSKKLSLRASIKNMLSFKRRYVRGERGREERDDKKEVNNCPLPPTIAFGYPYKIDENFHSFITQLNRMPTYIQLVIFCLKETTV